MRGWLHEYQLYDRLMVYNNNYFIAVLDCPNEIRQAALSFGNVDLIRQRPPPIQGRRDIKLSITIARFY
jgi:hypothetical protein